MTLPLIKYSSIGQFRNLVKDIEYQFDAPPKLTFTGTVKIHGTNSSVVILPDGTQYAQSRNNILTPEFDNAGFAKWHEEHRELFAEYRKSLHINVWSTVVIYGEFAGKGIQKGVAVSEVDKFFYVFGVKIIDRFNQKIWLDDSPEFMSGNDIIDSKHVWKHELEIDFSSPKSSQNTLTELTEEVEKCCPVGFYMGVNGVGEGIVWEHITEYGTKFAFKIKGAKHSVTRVRTLAEVDIEKLNSVNEFVKYAVTKSRLEQGFSEVCNNNADRRMLGQFIKWVSMDVKKEESDVLDENELTMKDVGRSLSDKAKTWFFEQEDF